MQKTKLIILFCFIALVCQSNTNIWLATNSKVRFFSVTPIEDIEAENNTAVGALNAKTGRIFFKAMMRSFKFEKALMQEHFNENYLESKQFPKSTFKGTITNMKDVDLKKDGSYAVTITGDFTIHGVTKNVTEKGTITVKDGKISATASIEIALADYKIKSPKTDQVIKTTINIARYELKK